MKEKVKVFAPATVANVVCGFDVLGFAVDYPGDEVEICFSGTPGVTIRHIEGAEGKLPMDPQKNTVGIAVTKFLEALGTDKGVEISLYKKMPLGSGLGSSAASSVAGVSAVNHLFGQPFTKDQLLPFALEGERIACGSAHADNVAPALYGGFVLIRSYNPLDIIPIKVPKRLYCVIIHPHVEIQTRDARDILRKEILLKDAVKQWGNVGGLIAGLFKGDYDLIGRSMEDFIIEPVRSILIPGFYNVKNRAKKEGALGAGISGSGPSLFALCRNKASAEKVARGMQQEWKALDVKSEYYISHVNNEGPRVMDCVPAETDMK